MSAAAAATGTMTVPTKPRASRPVDRCSSGTRSTNSSCAAEERSASADRRIWRGRRGRSLTPVDDEFRPRREGSVDVAGRRAVGFAEWGDPDGRPVVGFHGGPGSRLMAVGCEELADELGLRIVVLERPGFGLSEFAPDRTLLGWTNDVADATRALGLDHFAVVGVSAGSPYALA